MRCIFCKQDSSSSRSREHIIPESLGNVDHVLPPGVVCDTCNNYLAREVEKPFLDSFYVRDARFKMAVPNKKGIIPSVLGLHVESATAIEMAKTLEDGTSIRALKEDTEQRFIQRLMSRTRGTLIFPVNPLPDNYIIARFLAKIGIEVLAFRLFSTPGGLAEVVNKPELDEIRWFARRGTPGNDWPFSTRTIYSPDTLFTEETKGGTESFEVLHEFDLLYTEGCELYLILAIFGEEFVINLGGRSIDGYQRWLDQNKGCSPLYAGRNRTKYRKPSP